MAKSYLKLDTRRPLKDGTYPIVVAVGYGKDVQMPTKMSAFETDWDEKSQTYLGPDASLVNSVLRTVLAKTTARVLELRESGMFDDLDTRQVRAMLKDTTLTSPPKAKEHTLADLFALLIATKAKRTGEIYASTLSRLRLYCDPAKITFDKVNKMWLDGFVASMAGISSNTKSIHLRNLRAVNNYAIDCEITRNYPFRRYQMPRQTSRKKALHIDVLRNIAGLSLGHNAIYRDIFMLTFYLIGINFVDLCNLSKIEDGRVNYSRAKTHKPYSIKVEPEALEIIERLKGKRQLLYMLDDHKDYRSYYRQLRRGLEAVIKAYNAAHPDAPISELTTYWARHSWATIAASLDIPKETIAAALGHEMGNSMTAIYIDFDRAKVDAANRRVIDYVLGKSNARPLG